MRIVLTFRVDSLGFNSFRIKKRCQLLVTRGGVDAGLKCGHAGKNLLT